MEEPKVRSRRILVVDDHTDSAESLAILLRLMGHEVMTCYDGPAALAAAATFLPQIAFLDIAMPRMSGYEVAKRLREIPELQSTVLVALSGWGREEDRLRAQEAGFAHHFIKPTEPSSLKQFLADLP
jgi:two-component system CheB/CheR fusion protein